MLVPMMDVTLALDAGILKFPAMTTTRVLLTRVIILPDVFSPRSFAMILMLALMKLAIQLKVVKALPLIVTIMMIALKIGAILVLDVNTLPLFAMTTVHVQRNLVSLLLDAFLPLSLAMITTTVPSIAAAQ